MLEVWGYLFLKNVIDHFFICFSVVWILCTSVQILPFTSQQPCHTVHVWNRCNWSILVTSFALVWTTDDWLFWRKTHRVFFIAVRTAYGFNVLIGTACHMNWLYRALFNFLFISFSPQRIWEFNLHSYFLGCTVLRHDDVSNRLLFQQPTSMLCGERHGHPGNHLEVLRHLYGPEIGQSHRALTSAELVATWR